MRVAHAHRLPVRPRTAARDLLLAVLAALAALPCAYAAQPEGGARRAGAQASQTAPGQPRRVAARASTLADYHARLREAAAQLEELASLYRRVKESEKPEVWSREDFNSDFVLELPKKEVEALAKARALLPARERVEWGGGSFAEVDNSWLHSTLAEFARDGDYEKRALVLGGAAGRLRALEAQLAEAESAPAALDKDAERGRLNAILRDPAFNREAPKQGGALQRLLEQIREWLRELLRRNDAPLRPGASPRATKLAQFLVLGLCFAVIVYVARRLWLRRGRGLRALKLKRGPRVVLGERLEADQSAADLLDAAERLARTGDLRGAIRKAYVALLCELGDRGVIRLAQHKTNRDYLEAVRRAAAPRLYTEMLPLTFDFELHWYGLQPASDSDWEGFRARCRKAIKEAVDGSRSAPLGGRRS